MTIWAKDSESDSQLYDNVQVEIGCDAKDIWLAFNKSTAAVQMTHEQASRLIIEMIAHLRDIGATSKMIEALGEVSGERGDR